MPYRPDFFLIGAAKSGTTYLASLLGSHPDIFLCERKEPCFFSNDEIFSKGMTWYQQLFSKAEPHQISFEASTNYSRMPELPHSAQRIYEFNPKAKFIYLMRHPIDRTYSHYIHRNLKEDYHQHPFEMNLEEHCQVDTMCINSSNYQLQINEYLRFFPKDQILFLLFEDLKNSPYDVLKQIFSFLNLEYSSDKDFILGSNRNCSRQYLETLSYMKTVESMRSFFLFQLLKKHLPKSLKRTLKKIVRRSPIYRKKANKYTPPPLTTDQRLWLGEKFKASNAWVSEFIGRDLSHWNS